MGWEFSLFSITQWKNARYIKFEFHIAAGKNPRSDFIKAQEKKMIRRYFIIYLKYPWEIPCFIRIIEFSRVASPNNVPALSTSVRWMVSPIADSRCSTTSLLKNCIYGRNRKWNYPVCLGGKLPGKQKSRKFIVRLNDATKGEQTGTKYPVLAIPFCENHESNDCQSRQPTVGMAHRRCGGRGGRWGGHVHIRC